ELADQMELAGWSIQRTSDAQSRPIRLARIAITCWLRRNYYEVAHIAVYSGPAFILAEVAALTVRVSRRPLVLSLHGGALPSFARRWPRRVKSLLSLANVVTAPSEYLRSEMRSYRNDLVVLPNPLETRKYEFEPCHQAKPRLLWLRAFHRIYNPSLAPKVLDLLRPDFSDVQLTMVGPDKGDGSLQATRQTAANRGVTDRMTVVCGVRKEEVPGWMRRADIFL